MTTRAAIYARYSSDLQKATSIEDQIAMAERFCAEQGWSVSHVFTDHLKTGRHTRRPGFQELKAAVNRREVDMVVIEAVDRLTRRIVDALSSFDLFAFQGVGLHSVTEGRQDFYRILLTSFGAQSFSEMIGQHTRRGMQGALKRQRLHTRAYGYRKVDAETGLNRAAGPETARIVLRIFEVFASGRSIQQISRQLNMRALPPRTAAPGTPPRSAATVRAPRASCATASTSARPPPAGWAARIIPRPAHAARSRP